MKLWRPERRRAALIGKSLLPAGLYDGLRDGLDLGEALSDQAARSPWWAAALIRLSVWLVWLSPPLVGMGLRTLGGLTEFEREHLLERLLMSDVYLLRQCADLLKLMLCLRFLGDEEVLRRIGAYDLRRPRQLALKGVR